MKCDKCGSINIKYVGSYDGTSTTSFAVFYCVCKDCKNIFTFKLGW